MSSTRFAVDVAILGGCGRVGLPLGVAMALRGLTVTLYDVNDHAVALVNACCTPFHEIGLAPALAEVRASRRLEATTEPASLREAEAIIVVVDTPVDRHLHPDMSAVPSALKTCISHLTNDHLIVLRSTVPPGVTQLTEQLLEQHGLVVDVVFCPERIAEGHALTELFVLPQIIGARSRRAADRASKLFRMLTDQVVLLSPEEAEFAKLFTNAWRYLKFAIANQFFMMAYQAGVDYEQVRLGITHNYPRAADLPRAGFAAGPCLLKDTMQLAAADPGFALGHLAMRINEGLPQFIVSCLTAQYDLSQLTVGIMGMAFKSGSDDARESLSYRLRTLLALRAREVLCTDPFVRDDTFVPVGVLLEQADLIVIATPHPEYRDLDMMQPVVDPWGLTGHGARIGGLPAGCG